MPCSNQRTDIRQGKRQQGWPNNHKKIFFRHGSKQHKVGNEQNVVMGVSSLLGGGGCRAAIPGYFSISLLTRVTHIGRKKGQPREIAFFLCDYVSSPPHLHSANFHEM